MPIRPENRTLYPPAAVWRAIRARILKRAGQRCEFCGVANGAVGYRDDAGIFHEDKTGLVDGDIRIVLTIAHLDHDPSNNDADNLAALCQRCHNRHDAAHRARNRRARERAAYVTGDLFTATEESEEP